MPASIKTLLFVFCGMLALPLIADTDTEKQKFINKYIEEKTIYLACSVSGEKSYFYDGVATEKIPVTQIMIEILELPNDNIRISISNPFPFSTYLNSLHYEGGGEISKTVNDSEYSIHHRPREGTILWQGISINRRTGSVHGYKHEAQRFPKGASWGVDYSGNCSRVTGKKF